MKGTEKIIAHIKADAQAEAEKILGEAKKQCAAIKADYDKKAEDSYAEKIRAGVKACEDAAESKDRIAQMESKKSVLALKQELVNTSFEKAVEKILSMPEKEYIDFLTKLVVESVATGDEEIILNENDSKKFGKAVVEAANAQIKNGKLKLSEQTGEFKGGVVLKRGNVEVNNTLELLIDLCRSEMSSLLAKVLFE